MATFTSPQGVPMREIRELSAEFRVHPKHAPFIIGPKGANIKNLCRKSGAYIRIVNPRNKTNGEFPWFKITADNIRAVEHGYLLVRDEANKADQKMPLMNKNNAREPTDANQDSPSYSPPPTTPPTTPPKVSTKNRKFKNSSSN